MDMIVLTATSSSGAEIGQSTKMLKGLFALENAQEHSTQKCVAEKEHTKWMVLYRWNPY